MSLAERAVDFERRDKARTFGLYAKALARTGGRPIDAIEYLRLTSTPSEVKRQLDELRLSLAERVTRAPVSGGTTTGWGAGLVGPEAFGEAFLAELAPLTVLGQLAHQAVPSRTLIPADLTATPPATWVLEGRAAPLFKGSLGAVSLPGDPKLSLACAFTKELAESSDPAAELVFSNKLRNGIARGTDKALLDPALTATAETPASITHGAPGIPSTGLDADAVSADLAALSAMLTAAGIPFPGRAYISSPAFAEYLGALRYPDGSRAFPALGAAGGDHLGVPWVVSDECGPQVVLVHAPSLLVADGGIELAVSRFAAMELSDAPAGGVDPPAPAQLVSMMQTNSVALLGLRFLNFAMGRPGAVAVLTGVEAPARRAAA